VGYRTFIRKECPVVFKVLNIAPEGKRIKLFNSPIKNGMVRDLLEIDNVSEDVIRHSLLKGELHIKLKAKEAYVVESNIELLQFDECHRQFLIDSGINIGVDPSTIGGGGTGSVNYAFKQQVTLIGVKDGVNRIFSTPDKFINGLLGNNDFHILIKHNGRDLVENIDYFIAESGGTGSGFDTIILNFSPKPRSILVADYVINNI
jgi:hypothetical protein